MFRLESTMLEADGQKERSLDPRARLCCAVLLGGCAVLASSLGEAMIWAVVAVACLVTRPHAARGLRAFAGLNGFMVMVWLTTPMSVPGETVYTLGPLHLTREGVMLATLLTVKANASLGFLLAFCGNMDTVSFGAALQRMGTPSSLVILFMLLCRHLFTLREEFMATMRALRLRTRKKRRGMRETLYLYACMLCSVLVRCTDKAERVRMAIQCKRGSLQYDTESRLCWRLRDTVACALCVVAVLISGYGVPGGHLVNAVASF